MVSEPAPCTEMVCVAAPADGVGLAPAQAARAASDSSVIGRMGGLRASVSTGPDDQYTAGGAAAVVARGCLNIARVPLDCCYVGHEERVQVEQRFLVSAAVDLQTVQP